jgi:dihydroorotate dehydrogenase (fumarate)
MSEFYGDKSDFYIQPDEEIDVSTTLFGGTKLQSVLYNASGVMCTEYYQLQSVLSSSHTGAVVTKSCTLESRKGNPEPRYADSGKNALHNWSINSMGIPNNGIDYYLDGSRSGLARLDLRGKPYIVSVSGLSVLENLDILDRIRYTREPGVTAVELNLSCPNIVGKPQMCYDFEGMEDTLRRVFERGELRNIALGLKMSPYFDVAHFDRAAEVLEPFANKISFLTCSNSIGNGLLVDADTESTLIHPKRGLGGCGGDCMRPVALSNVYNFHRRLGDRIDIIGCGGVSTGDDVFNLILAGAKAVQVGTLLARRGVDVFKSLDVELKQRMVKNGYLSIEQFRGKLKPINSKL